jgi:hypothetical protein
MSEDEKEQLIIPEELEEDELEEFDRLEQLKGMKIRPLEMRKGKTAVVYLRLANMAIRGYSTNQIADELGLDEHRVTKLLKDNKQIWDYIQRHLEATFSEGDRILAYLYKKAMMSLDDELSSGSADVRQKAREQVFDMLKIMGMGRTNDKEGEVHDNRSVIFNQFFGGNKSPISGKIQSMDDLILMKRKERGLETKLLTRGADDDKDQRPAEVGMDEKSGTSGEDNSDAGGNQDFEAKEEKSNIQIKGVEDTAL